jgi:hypothetical protein
MYNNKKNISYIYFNIKNYSKIDDVISIIKLIDNSICIQDKILETNTIIMISRSINLSYDYVFITSVLCDNDIVKKYFISRFKQIENDIKENYNKYGKDWYIDFTLV